MSRLLFISNYPSSRSPDDVARALSDLFRPAVKLSNPCKVADGLAVSLETDDDQKLVHSMCGSFVFNSRVWIAKLPTAAFGNLCPYLSQVFEAHMWHGQVDLSSLSNKVAEVGGKQKVVDFKNLDFVEFLWLRLGTESRDNCFMVHTLILSSNGIEDVTGWVPFQTFLPHLHFLWLTNNPLKFAPKFIASEWLEVKVTKATLPDPNPPELLKRPLPWFRALRGTETADTESADTGSADADQTTAEGRETGDERVPNVQSAMEVQDLTTSELKNWSNVIGAAQVIRDIPAGVELPTPFLK
jgi:hypothetical protein